jgi:branched-chain amino acid transport system ATP-binding protein
VTAEPLLSVKDLRVTYGPALALDKVSVDIPKGSAVAVLGPNGAGKSTFARAVSGLIPTAGGTILFDGADITKRPAHTVRRHGMVYLPEGRGIFPGLTLSENLRMASMLLPRLARGDAISRGLELFPNLAARRGTKAGSLSGGEQQMLSLCRALTVQPKLIIADELSLGLAPKLVELVFESLAKLKQANITVLIIEQFVHRALEFADRAVLLSRAHVAWQGPTDDAKAEVLAQYLGDSAAASVA